jgi:putative ABC transport system substrate-binding protein
VIERRTFLAGAGAVILTAPLAAEAQQAGKVYRVGLIFTTAPVSEMMGPNPAHPLVRSFLDELRALGYVQGRNLVFEPRSAEGRFERFREILEELVSLKMDVLVVNGNSMTQDTTCEGSDERRPHRHGLRQ